MTKRERRRKQVQQRIAVGVITTVGVVSGIVFAVTPRHSENKKITKYTMKTTTELAETIQKEMKREYPNGAKSGEKDKYLKKLEDHLSDMKENKSIKNYVVVKDSDIAEIYLQDGIVYYYNIGLKKNKW